MSDVEKKPVVHMTDWCLYVYAGMYNLSGVADTHPRLGKNTYVVYTSSLEKYDYNEDMLFYETRNTIYICPLKYMSVAPYHNVTTEYKAKLSQLDEMSCNILDKIIAATARLNVLADKYIEETKATSLWVHKPGRWDEVGVYTKDIENELDRKIVELREVGGKEIAEEKERENKRRLDIVKQYEDSIYIEMSHPKSGDTLAYHLGKELGIVEPQVHVGTFQDSVLYIKSKTADEPCSMDFRYFSKGWFVADELETYCWSDNIKQVVIKNVHDIVLTFNGYKINPGETKVFMLDTHQLLSTNQDYVNATLIVE